MSATLADEPAIRGEPCPHRHRISVQDLRRMVDVGLLARDARIELIEGDLIDMARTGARHRSVVQRLGHLLQRAAGAQARVCCHSSIRLGTHSQPEPDLAVLRIRPDGCRDTPPGAADALLVIEVSDTTWHYDHDIKVPFYARHGIAEVWLFDLASATAHFFRALADGHYTDEYATDRPGVTFLPELTDAAVDLSELLPSA